MTGDGFRDRLLRLVESLLDYVAIARDAVARRYISEQALLAAVLDVCSWLNKSLHSGTGEVEQARQDRDLYPAMSS